MKLANFRPSKIRINLELLQLEWEPKGMEVKVLRAFLNELSTRRAFQINRGMALEEPVLFLASVSQFREEIRKLVNELPPQAKESRITLLTAIDWAGELLDAWHLALRELAPNTWEFSKLPLRDMMSVMEKVWPMVETVRDLLGKLADNLEQKLGK